MLNIDVSYLELTWHPNRTLKSISVSDTLTLNPSEIKKSAFEVETMTFRGVDNYIGFHIKDISIEHPPYFIRHNQLHQELMPIEDPHTGKTWWIECNAWDDSPTKTRVLSELMRTAGRYELIIQNSHLYVLNHSHHFSLEDLQHMLADFQHNLWMLVLDNNSTAQTNVSQQVPFFSHKTLHYFKHLIEDAEELIQKPHIVLSEVQTTKPLREVRPTPRTFREYAIAPFSREYTSRDFYESLNTPENQYIHYCLKRALVLLEHSESIQQIQHHKFNEIIKDQELWLTQNEGRKTKTIDKVVLEQEINRLKAQQEQINDLLINDEDNKEVLRRHLHSRTYTIQLKGVYGKRKNEFFFEFKENFDYDKKDQLSYLVFRFSPLIWDKIQGAHGVFPYSTFEIAGVFDWNTNHYSSQKKNFAVLTLKAFEHITFIQNTIIQSVERRQSSYQQYAENNWQAPLSRDELDDIAIESKMLRNNIQKHRENQSLLKEFEKIIPPLIKRLKKVLQYLQHHKVGVKNSCPNSMVFIQNPHYAGIKSAYRNILLSGGLNEHMLDTLTKVDSIGLINTASLYEYWCLLKIIDVLNQHFYFELIGDWQQRLIDAVAKKEKNISFEFYSQETCQRITLYFQKELANGNRPDFVLFIENLFDEKTIPSTEQINFEINESSPSHQYLIMDAKFKTSTNENFFYNEIDKLLDKGYQLEQNNARVFILHPNIDLQIHHDKSPLEAWGNHCQYGQWHNHRTGFIPLSPTSQQLRNDEHLHRLVGLFLQSNTHIIGGNNKILWHNIHCMNCGNHDKNKLTLSHNQTKGGHPRIVSICLQCTLESIYTICFSCDTRLYKNSSRWTYHQTRPEQLTNIVCPACNEILDKFFNAYKEFDDEYDENINRKKGHYLFNNRNKRSYGNTPLKSKHR
ncbi:nuclease domain-containing protein [Pelistega sp. MC2]|uniref:nuclease domain-containing protein n=1 Tax=Pelistega sp. MC2 TaxID=1720297 RepID=UPI0008D9C30A|nr:nuclease domain-containing protein [Pelistega sp. MC2]